MIFDQEVELGEELSPSSLLCVQLLSCYEILEGSVISQYLELFFGLQSFQLCLPLLECLDDSKQFLVMDLIVLFSIWHALGIEGNRVLVLSILLSEYFCHHSIRGICFQLSLQFGLIIIEYRGIHQLLLQFFKGLLALVIPYKGYFSFSQLVQWLCYSAIVLDESLVEIAEPKEGLDSSYCVGDLPVINYLYLFWVDFNAFCCQDES